MPFYQVLDQQHQESWEVDLPGTHRQETLQENPTYAQVRPAAIRLCKPSHTDGQACQSTYELEMTRLAPTSRQQDSCSLPEGQQILAWQR